jgi:prepilin-type N-terminal cleavage/methylation domain-containing protein
LDYNKKHETFENRGGGMKKNRGFSLIEMMVSLLIITIVSYIITLKISDYFKILKFHSDIYSIRSIIQKVRVRAILKYETLKVSFKDSGLNILKYDGKKWRKIKTYDFGGITLKSNNTPIFHPYGTVSKLFSLYIISKNGIKKITMNINGRINIY